MATLPVRFITEADPISFAIRKVTRSLISHVDLGTPEGTWIGAHAIGGVQERPADYCKPTWTRTYDLKVGDAQLAKALSIARAKIGSKYDFATTLGILFDCDRSTDGTEDCSMFLFEVLLAIGIQALNVLPHFSNLVTPEMLHTSTIWIGKEAKA